MFDVDELVAAADAGLIRRQRHPTADLWIHNYTERCAYEGAWTPVTRACRGLILDAVGRVVARPFPKFFNHGERHAPDLDLDALVMVSDKVDGSLGILYPLPDGTHAIATRGSFTSDQAIHATDVWWERYAGVWAPLDGWTYLFEIVYPENRIVVDYGGLDDLVWLATISNDDGNVGHPNMWPGPRATLFLVQTVRDVLETPPRPGQEGLVLYLPELNDRVKVKQDEYVALHRILTGTNARNVWEVAAVRACAGLIREPKHWGTYLGIDPARADQVIELGDDWLDGVPDEFYGWIRETTQIAETAAHNGYVIGLRIAQAAREIEDRRARYEHVLERAGVLVTEVMRLACAETEDAILRHVDEVHLAAWRASRPEPTAPFAAREAA